MLRAKQVMRYLSKAVGYELNLEVREGVKEPYSMVALDTDSDFVSDPNSMKLMTGMGIGDRYSSRISWQSKKQANTG